MAFFDKVVKQLRGFNLPTGWFLCFAMGDPGGEGTLALQAAYPLEWTHPEPNGEPFYDQERIWLSDDGGVTKTQLPDLPGGWVAYFGDKAQPDGGVWSGVNNVFFTAGSVQIGFGVMPVHEDEITIINQLANSDPATATGAILACDPANPADPQHPSLDHATPYLQSQVSVIDGWLRERLIDGEDDSLYLLFINSLGFATPSALATAMKQNPKADVDGNPPGNGSFCGRLWNVFSGLWVAP